MKPKFLILILVLLLSGNLVCQEKYIITFPYKNLSFEEFVTITESRLPVRFYFKESWTDGLKLSEYPGCYTLTCILDQLFRERQLHYFINETGNIVLTGNTDVRDMNVTYSGNLEIVQPDDQDVTSRNKGGNRYPGPDHRES